MFTIFNPNNNINIYFFFSFYSRVMRCSLNVIPETKDILNKSRLPLGILIHPFKDLEVNKIYFISTKKTHTSQFSFHRV